MLMTYGKGKKVNKTLYFLKKHAPLMLTGVSILTGAGACIFSARGALKADRLIKNEKPVSVREKASIYIRSYWPAGLCFVGSSAASIFSHTITVKQIAVLTSACIAAEEKFRKYRNAIKERLGEEEERKIYISETVDPDWGISPPLPRRLEGDTGKQVFYEVYSERFFESTVEQVNQAMYHLNRNFVMRGYAFLNEYFEMLGIAPTDKGEVEGWCDAVFLEDYGMTPWIDFGTDIQENEDGTYFYILYTDIEPSVEAIDRVYS